MKAIGLAWVGSSSPKLDEMTHLFGDVLGLEVGREQEDARVFALPDGSAIEVFKPTDVDHSFFEHPVAGIVVDDVREVRAHMEASGIEFIGEVHDGVEDSWATAWSHFRAPDGYMYVLVSKPDLTPVETRTTFDELRICLRVKDLDAAIRAYRDGLGLDVVDEWTHAAGQRGVLFGATYAAVELFDEDQWDLVDDAEVGERLGRDYGLRIEVRNRSDLDSAVTRLVDAGARVTGDVVETPWEQTCQRVTMPDGEQVSVSILPASEAAIRADHRARLRPR
jgi:catechol 2,3-dioxygenase-like lactoylglutathione lyase family enzyme